MRFTSAVLLSMIFWVGCQHVKPGGTTGADDNRKPSRPPASKKGGVIPATSGSKTPRVTPVIEFRGKVAAVNANLRFVVIDFGLTALPQIGERMSVYRQGLKVGEVSISGPARERNIAADLTAGEAQAGDEVRKD